MRFPCRLRGEAGIKHSLIPGEGELPRVQLSQSPGSLPLTPTLSPQAAASGARERTADAAAALSSERPILFSLNRGPFPGKYPSNKAGD